MAALLALHQNPGKISLGVRLGASRSVPSPPTPIAGKHLQDCSVWSSGADMKWGATHERPFSQVGETGRVTETRKGECGNSGGASPRTCLLPPGLSDGRRLRSPTLAEKPPGTGEGGTEHCRTRGVIILTCSIFMTATPCPISVRIRRLTDVAVGTPR